MSISDPQKEPTLNQNEKLNLNQIKKPTQPFLMLSKDRNFKNYFFNYKNNKSDFKILH